VGSSCISLCSAKLTLNGMQVAYCKTWVFEVTNNLSTPSQHVYNTYLYQNRIFHHQLQRVYCAPNSWQSTLPNACYHVCYIITTMMCTLDLSMLHPSKSFEIISDMASVVWDPGKGQTWRTCSSLQNSELM